MMKSNEKKPIISECVVDYLRATKSGDLKAI